MRMEEMKYVLISALISAIIWFAILEIDWRANLHLFWSLGNVGGPLVSGVIAFAIGTYLGLWSVGKVRKPSLAYGIPIGLVSLALFVLIISMEMWGYASGEGSYAQRSFSYWLNRYFSEDAPFDLIASLIGGVVGVVIVRRISPSFCPNCGNKLPSGRDPCPECGTKTF